MGCTIGSKRDTRYYEHEIKIAIGEELPDWLQSLSVQIQCQFPGLIPEFNQCLINEYQVGQGSKYTILLISSYAAVINKSNFQ